MGFRHFLGVTPTVAKWSADGKECSLLLDENPLAVFVELPAARRGLLFSNLLCGVLRGALEMVRAGRAGRASALAADTGGG